MKTAGLRTKRIMAGAIACVFVLSACAGNGGTTDPPAPTGEPTTAPTDDAPTEGEPGLVTSIDDVEPLSQSTPLRLGYNNNVLNLPLFFMVENGWLEQVGFEVEVTETRGSASAEFPPLLATGALDIAQGSPAPSMYNQIAEGFGIVISASLGVELEGRLASGWLAIRPEFEGEILELEDLVGRTFEGLTEAGPPGFVSRTILADAGLTDDVELLFRARAREDIFALVENEAADVYSLAGSFAVQAAQQGQLVLWKSWAEVLPWYQPSILTTSEEFNANQEALSKFMEVYLLASREINSTNGEWRQDLLDIAVKYTLVDDPSIITDQGGVPFYDPNGTINDDTIVRTQGLYVELGFVSQPVDPEDLLDTTALELALERIGRV